MLHTSAAGLVRGFAYGFAALSFTACATSGDLDQLRQELRASKGHVDTLQGETKSVLESLQRKLEEQERKLAELRGVQDTLTAVSARLADTQAKNDVMAKENQEFRAQVQLASRTLLDFFKSQDAHLRDELQWVQSALKNLAVEEKLPEEKPKAVRVR